MSGRLNKPVRREARVGGLVLGGRSDRVVCVRTSNGWSID